MSTHFTIVTFAYDLTSEANLNAEFKTVLEGLDWTYEISNTKFPQTTCLKMYDAEVSIDESLKLATREVKAVVKKFREQGFKNFNVERYFFLGHKTDSADAAFGENLV